MPRTWNSPLPFMLYVVLVSEALSLQRARASGPFASPHAASAAAVGAWVTGSSAAATASGGVQSMSPPCCVSCPLPSPELTPAQGVEVGAVPSVTGTQPSERPPIMKAVVRHRRRIVPLPDSLKSPLRTNSTALLVLCPSEQSPPDRLPLVCISNEDPVPRLIASGLSP